ncbi:MmgE/PrpD family protein [Xylophilus sp. GW821-FHT01B05]
MNSYTRQLGEFSAGLRLADVPPEVLTRAKSIVLDGLGCGLFGANLPWTRTVAGVARRVDPDGGTASVWGRGERASPVNATLINGTAIQGYELDDANPATIHSCAAILPAVFAAAEVAGTDRISGERLLTAIVAGFEVGPRVGLCMNGNQMLIKGWHAPGLFGVFPAAASSGVVLSLNAQQHYQALGIAGPQAAGTMAVQFGSMAKRMLSGKAAQTGLYSALLAADGFTGAPDIFEQEYGGFCTTFTQSTDKFDLTQLTEGLGTRWETMRISIKRHASVGTNMAALDAIELMVADAALKAEDIEHITVQLTQDGVLHSFWTPYVPVDLTAAQMHLGFCIAMKLIDGEVFVDQMTADNIGRPELVAFANERVSVVRNEARERKGRAFARGADVEVRLKDGRTLHKTVDNFLGSFQRPMSDEQMAQKYRRLARKSISAERTEEIENTVRHLEAAPSVRRLVELLRGS